MKQSIDSLRASLPYRSLHWGQGPHKLFKNPPKAIKPIVWASGGVGDTILSIGLAEAIERFLGEPIVFYTPYPDVARFFSRLDCRHEKEFVNVGADYWITVNTLVLFNFQNNFKGFKNPKMLELFLNYRSFIGRGQWEQVTIQQPYMDNLTGRLAVKEGYTRQTLPYAILGLPFIDYRIDLNSFFEQRNNLDGPYLTVHHGFDQANQVIGERATKNWSVKNWRETVIRIRNATEISVIQLGPKNAPDLHADYNLCGKLSLTESFRVIADSKLHLDTESGLVHAARKLNVKSLVLFGPTNKAFFGYEGNINVDSGFCGNCWWLKHNWMDQCAIDYVAPLCMDKITPERVVDLIYEDLKQRKILSI